MKQTRRIVPLVLALLLVVAASAVAQTAVVLDRVVAVVNRHVILESDIADEIRLSVVDPDQAGAGTPSRQRALEQLVSQSLVEQQIRQEDAETAMPTPAEVETRVNELRHQLPACAHENCASDAAWNAFLAEHALTPDQVTAYMRHRMEILRFIELRFRAGIHISEPEIAAYYRNTLLPQYKTGEQAPPLDHVSSRIEQILLEQHVNVLFDQWLTSLRKQGDVEILDRALETAENRSTGAGSSE